jgi:hypothetical protein
LNLKYQENEWNSSRTQGRRVLPPHPPPLVGIVGVGMHVVTWAGIQGQDREVGPMPGLIRAVNIKVAQIQLAAAGFSLLEERNITCPNDMKKRGLERWLPVLSLFTSSSSMACLAFYFLRVFSYLKVIRMSTEFIWRVCLAIQFDMFFF